MDLYVVWNGDEWSEHEKLEDAVQEVHEALAYAVESDRTAMDELLTWAKENSLAIYELGPKLPLKIQVPRELSVTVKERKKK